MQISKQNGNKGRRFDRAFKEEAVRLLQTSGRRQRQIAGDLGISYNFGRMITTARAEPVIVEKHGRPVVVVLAVEKYEKLTGEQISPSQDKSEN